MKYSRFLYPTKRIKAILLSFLALFCVLTAQAQNRIYVSPQGEGTGEGTSWENTTTFDQALAKAKAGDEIWLKGFQQITNASQLYVAPVDGWTVPSGVKIFGGFEGTETSITQRKTLGKAYQMTFRSVLSGDINRDDVIDPNNSIFPENTTRSDNAKHVLVLNAFRDEADNLNDNSNPTVVDGLTIVGGHAADFGGGIYVKGDANTPDNSVPYSIDRCYLLNNYGYKGGAIYVDASVKKVATQSLINQCVVYNNVAGAVIGKENLGGGIYIHGAGNIVNCSVFNNENGGVKLSPDAYLVNTTVARNTGAGVDMTASPAPTEVHVYNSVIWGNSFVAAANWPVFSHSAYPDVPEEDKLNNINLSKNNQGDEMSPRFDAPSLKTSFDIDYDWRRNAYPLWSWKLREGSYLIGKGNNDAYNTYAKGYNGVIGTDLNGTARIVGKIDINAYEFETVPASRIRYVKTDGNDSNDGQTWGTAYASVQKAIDDLALSQPGVPGEVWVAAGTYSPKTRLTDDSDSPASFRMYDGISVYGGFAGTELSKEDRGKGAMPWIYTNQTIFEGTAYDGENVWNESDHKWTLESGSVHVVWFAPLPGEEEFTNITVLDGVTIQGGKSNSVESVNYDNTKGAGVYMRGRNVCLNNSIVKDNVSLAEGGGIYLEGGRVQGCLVYNNSSETRGGAIYMDNSGLVLRSMLTNNAALEGGAIYMDNYKLQEDGQNHPEYQILSTSVVSNNTSVHNGAVYCNKGGIILQTTITNNYTPTATDNASGDASQTGGLYINEYAKVINSVLWNNKIIDRPVQLYAKNPTSTNVGFYYCAVANMNNIVWNNTLQNGLISLSEENITNSDNLLDPGFVAAGLPGDVGVDETVKKVSYFWQPIKGSNLRARGMELGRLPQEVLVAPELDIQGSLFAQKPAIGAYRVEQTPIIPEEPEGGDYIRIYVDTECTIAEHNGNSWETAYRSLNEAIEYMAALTADEVKGKKLEIYVLEGDIWPRYASVNLDPKTATIEVPAMASGQPLIIKGGYSRELKDGTCAPLTYRSQINGNHEGKNIEDGLYHCITVENNAKVEFDGFHIINGYAAGTANLKYGAGMLVREGADVTVKNSIFENNTAVEGAAIDARDAKLTLINCVVNNNTNKTATASVINCTNLTMNHVSVVNNIGAAPASSENVKNSFAVGNSYSNTQDFTVDLSNFANPTKNKGAILGYDTYLGGYSSFLPTNQAPVVNKGTTITDITITQDIAGSNRVLGGAPDLGAYEANLPAEGEVIYVRQGGTGDGSSWDKATGSIQTAINNATKEVWVAAGTYNERITLKNDVDVLGGFAKTGNPDNKLDGTNRDISNSNPDFMTIIDGQNGGRVVTQSGDFTNLTTVEGFIIQNGRTSGEGTGINGAGAYIKANGKLKNCKIQKNQIEDRTTDSYFSWGSKPGAENRGGGGVYVDGGIIESCIITENSLKKTDHTIIEAYEYTCGAGVYLNGGTLINSLIIKNSASTDVRNNSFLGVATYISKAGNFYNCTFAENTGNVRTAILPGVWDNTKNSNFYNCIFWGNVGYGGKDEECVYQVGGSGMTPLANMVNCYASIADLSHTTSTLWKDENVTYQVNSFDPTTFAETCNSKKPYDENYRLLNNTTGKYCINKGDNEAIENNNIVLDAAGQRRIQYCTVDKGAYESTNAITIKPDGNGIFYVTQGGAGSSDGSSVGNASCAMELQRVLNAAGELVEKGQTVTVKIAGYENGAFKYRANTLSDDADPQSYTFVVPYGVIVEGGYNDQESEWNDANRNPYKYQTVLSALAQGDGQDINGYHVITFGEPGTASGKQTIIDGLYLIEGKATSMAGGNNPNTRGGGAVVPDWAHVRNCVVAQCEAIQGGALYLLPGATVSGTLIMENKAEDGAGVYADAEGAGKALRAHMISNTITDNTASEVGGGIYLEDGAVLTTNSVIWGNTAPSDKNVSGVVNSTFEDDKFTQVVGEGAIPEFYPFNHCYVETYEMPSNYENTSMQSDESLYFATDRTLKAYSELVKHGTVNYEKLITVFDVAEKDMQGVARKQNNIDRVDVGAYAFEGGIIPLPKNESDIVKRIFVSQGSNVNLTEGNSIDTYIGRSFYTSVSWLDDAIDYIKKVRATDDYKYKDVKFEIYLAGGTYKPSNRRTDATTTTIDQRQNSYVIPAGVTIYGGFKGDEKYGYGISSIPIAGQEDPILLVPIEDDNLNTFLEERTYSDLNGNGVDEPWEFENQSILSGNVNVSTTVKNAYHVVFSSAEPETANTDVILDGVTIKDGETINELSNAVNTDERGRGGAIYTNGVNYVLRGCRVMNCKAIRGGAIYSRDADVTIMGSVIAGNGTVEGELKLNGQDVRGGAVYISAYNEPATLKAVNTLWANNETTGKGGAIATSNDLGFTGSATVSLMNNTFVRNKASENSAIHATAGTVTNSVMWGGEGTGVASESLTFVNCASDGTISGNGCIKLNAQNMALDGPRFAQPSETAGVAGNNIASKWNPASVSVLTDAGDGQLAYESEDVTAATGAYRNWFAENKLDDNFYFDDDAYKRYMGPKPLPDEEAQPKVIDMGVYEYQYQTRFAEMDKIYVDTKENGNGSGDSWANATSDLRGAIIALSNPTGGSADKYIYIKGGDYPQSKLYTGDIAYRAVMASDNNYLNSLTIEGSYAENTQQDFSKPTRILPSTVGSGVNILMYVKTSGKKLTVKGIEFSGSKVAGLQIDNTGEVTLKNVAFRNNAADGAVLSGKVLVANALFADGGTGVKAADGSDVTVVNATFANNKTAGINGTVKLYNSVAWNSGNEITDDSAEGNINLHNVANNDVLNGPNFVNPEQGNYMIRPSIKLLDLANNDKYTTLVGALGGDKDLANNNRLTGDRLDIGAYEYNAQLQPVVYVKAGVVNSDGSGSSWENPISDLQSAVDLASIYANKNSQETAYVFVHKNVKSENIRLTMPRVKVYGGMNDEVGAGAQDVLGARTSVLADNMSTINGLTLAGESSVIDGFAVTGIVNVNGGMLSTSVVNGDATVATVATVGADGVVYNSYVSGELTGAGKAVNVTSPVAVSVTSKINVVENAQPNGYVSDDIWKYQLKEDNIAIDNSQNSDIADYITLAGHSKDLSGSKRVRNTVDAGCFESWNITTNTTLSADDMPTNKHVVYVRKGVEADIAEGLYPDGTNFNVGFLLLEHGAGLRSNGNAIELKNFAVERSLTADNNHWDMCYMPFAIVKTEGADGVAVKTYNGEKRAAYDYQFSATDGAWEKADNIIGKTGLLLQSTADAKVRMYGNSYTEVAGQSGQVRLAKYNNMQPWNSENSGTSQKFTHLENMSWNMFGSPFLCAMNYDDMEYGRVIYKKGGDTYASVNTSETFGSIEAGSAVFTQTATLQTNEVFNVNQRTSVLSEAGTRTRLAVAVAPQGQGEQDELTLTAVPTEEASDQFNMAADGVKMMTVGKAAQIYLERGGKHYSMLTALDLEGKIDVGVLAPESGMYSIFIPEDCPMEDYETVVLEDKTNGRMVDLLEGGYDFQMNEAGTLNSRFTLSFNRELAEQGLTRIRIQAMGNGQVRITGLMDGDQITAYQENGTMTYSQRVASAEKNIALPGKVCLIKVVAADGSEIVKKLVIR